MLISSRLQLAFAITVIAILLSIGGALAFFGSPSAITGKSSGGGGGGGTVSCTIGPPYQGSVPAIAAAAGFNTCAVNLDFTQTGAFTDSLGTHTWSTLASWFACPDSGSANGFILYNTNNLNSGTQPCSDTAIVTDNNGDPGASGGQVLEILWTATDFTNGTQVTQLNSTSSFNNPTPHGYSLPTGMFVEIVDRLTAATYNNNHPSGGVWTPYYSDVFWGSYGNVGSNCEFDFIERYFPQTATGGQSTGSACGSAPNPSGQVGAQAGYSNTVYSNAGVRLSMNSSGAMEFCKYLNGSLLSSNACATGALTGGSTGAVATQRNVLLLWSGPNAKSSDTKCTGSAGGCAPSSTYTELIQRITFWSCATWQTTACVTNNP